MRPAFLLPLLALLPAAALALPTGIVTPKPFETSATLDALFTAGNANKSEVGARLDTQGATPYFDSVRGSAAYAYGESRVDRVKSVTAKRWLLGGNARRPLDLYKTYTFVDGRIESDAVAELNYRATEGGGAGLYLKHSEKLNWTADAGLFWIFEETSDGSENYPGIRLSERFEYEWKSGAKAVHNAEVLCRTFRMDRFFANADAGIETVITELLRLRILLEYKYQNQPPEDTKTYDLRLAMGVSAKF